MKPEVIYLDHSATTPVDPVVFAAMEPYFKELYGNPSSLHRQGQRAEAAVESARETIAKIFGCHSPSIFFTSCATESNNIVLKGLVSTAASRSYNVHTTPVEHPSVIEPLLKIHALSKGTYSLLPVDRTGQVMMDKFEEEYSDEITLVSVIFGNNEIGTVNSIARMGRFLKERPTLLHTDAVQTANFIELHVDELNVDFLTLSPHKFYGPKGVGILYARDPSLLEPIMQGGSQENGMRPGTHNVPLIVGAAKALELAQAPCEAESSRLQVLRDSLIDRVINLVPDCELTGARDHRLPHHASFVFADIDSNELLASLDLHGFACSSGSACKVGNPEPSALLLALGYPEDLASGALRVTLGKSSTSIQIDSFLETLVNVIEGLRGSDSVI